MHIANIFKYSSQGSKSLGILPEWFIAVLLCISLSLVIVISTELKGIYSIALFGGVLGTVFLFYFPQRRILLASAWILIHPLSIEKVFFIGEQLREKFFPPAIVVSASDVMLFALMIVLAAESLFTKNRFIWKWPKAMTPYAALVIWSFYVFIIRKPDAGSALAIIHGIKMIMFMLIIVSSVRTPGELKLIIYSICAAVLVQVIIVIISHLTGSAIHVSSKISVELMSFSGFQGLSHIRATGTVGHVNQEASFLTFFCLPLVALIFSSSRFWKTAGFSALAGGLVAIGLTFSRSAWISVVFAVLVVIIVAVKNKELIFKYWLYAMPFLLIGIIALPVVSKPVINRFLYGDDGATSSRKRAIYLAADLFAQHPLSGVGAGNFTRASLKYFPPEKKSVSWLNPGEIEREMNYDYGRIEISQVQGGDEVYDVPLPVHNKYLLIMTELGIIGLIFFLWFQFRIFIHIKKGMKNSDKMIKWLATGIAGAFFASQCYMNLDLFSDDKTMQILLIIPVLAMITDNITSVWDYNA